MSALVSVVVPCYNYGRYLGECFASLAAQSYPEWECIVVDDGSANETAAVCARLAASEPRARCIRREHAGVSAARNAGMREARGAYLQFLDADDLLEPEKLARQVEFLESHPEVDIVVGEAAFFEDGRRAELRPQRRDGGLGTTRRLDGAGAAVLREMVAGNPFVTHAALVRRSALDRVGGFDETLPTHEDWELWIRCARQGLRFAFVSRGRDRSLVREHSANASRAVEGMLGSLIEVRRRIHAALPAALQRENAARLADAQSRLAVLLWRSGKGAAGWKLYREALSSGMLGPKAMLRPLLLIPGMQTLASALRSGHARRTAS